MQLVSKLSPEMKTLGPMTYLIQLNQNIKKLLAEFRKDQYLVYYSSF